VNNGFISKQYGDRVGISIEKTVASVH